jgi:hypothetical protein
MTTDEPAAIVAAATERAGWQYDKIEVQLSGKPVVTHVVRDDNGAMIVSLHDLEDSHEKREEHGKWTANAPRTILALVERIRELEAQVEGLEAQVEAQESSVDEHQVMTLAQLSRYTGFTVTALRSACYHGLIKHWKINNNQHYASTIAEVRRYKANKGKNRTNQHKN